MSVYLVTWDLNNQKSNYAYARQILIKHLEGYDHIKDPGLDSVWFISTTISADNLDADIRTRMDENDRLMVTKLVTGQHAGWLSPSVWGWINTRL